MKKKMRSDLIWSLLSFVIMGAMGLCINFLIARYYGASALGLFNHSFAVFMVLSILSNCGISLSVLHFVAQNKNKVQEILISGVLLTFFTGLITVTIAYFLSPFYSYLFQSEEATQSFLYILPAVFFYSINRVMLETINALSKIRCLVFFQILRYVSLLVFLAVFVLKGSPASSLLLSIACGEILTFVSLIHFFKNYWVVISKTAFFEWIPKHFDFGVKAMWGNLALSLNAYVDVLMLGCFTTDIRVGIYSMASQLIDGINEIFYSFRFPITPYLGNEYAAGRTEKLCKWIRGYARKVYLFAFFVCLTAAILFSPVVNFIVGNNAFEESTLIFYILMGGVFMGAGYLPFVLFLSQVGHPAIQSKLRLCMVLTNITLNLLFIPLWGIYGAAAATAISMGCNVFLFKYAVKKTLHYRI